MTAKELLLESAVAEKRFYVASAERELQKFGEWKSDWTEAIEEQNRVIDRIWDEIKNPRFTL